MGPVYLAALIIGLGITGAQIMLSGDHGDVDHGDLDGDATPAGGDGPDGHGADLVVHDGDGAHHGADFGLLAVVLSIRFWTFGLLGFGLFGTTGHYLDLASMPVVLTLAVVVGLVAGAAASAAFRALATSSVGSGGESRDLLGHVGTVLIPVEPGKRGKVRIEVRGRTLDYLATSDGASVAAGDRVLVEEVDGNELRVGPVPPELME